jgi:DNA primase
MISVEGLTYLRSRYVTDATVIGWEIAHCGFNFELTSSMAIAPSFKISSPKFSNSIIIPVYDLYQKLLGIFSRKLNPINEPKVNGSSWEKLDHLFGLHKAYPSIVKNNNVFVVEGPFDCMMMHQFGYTNTVALMGTILSPTHKCLLSRFTDTITLMLDNDVAGVKAMETITNDLKYSIF